MGEEQEPASYIIDVDLGENGGRVTARTIEEFQEWLGAEAEFWSPLFRGATHGRAGMQGVQHLENVISHLRNFVSNFNSDPTLGREQITSWLQDNYGNRKVCHSSTDQAQFIIDLLNDFGAIEASAALTAAVGETIDASNISQLRGAVFLLMFEQGVSRGSARARSAAIQKVANKFEQRYSDDVDASDALKSNLSQLVAKHEKTADQAPRIISKLIKKECKRADLQRAQTADRLEAFEEVYRTGLALKAPVDYWKSKRKKHRGFTWAFSAAFLAYLFLLFYMGYLYLPESDLFQIQTWKKAEIGFIAIVVVFLGIVLSLARVLLKLTMSQLHLFNDADERVTMVQTYLALREGGHASADHIQIVLERMFAPAADGIVKEDMGPTSSLDAVRSIFGRN